MLNKKLIKEILSEIDNETLIIEDGKYLLYNKHTEYYEVYDTIKDIFSGAIWHREFQRCI